MIFMYEVLVNESKNRKTPVLWNLKSSFPKNIESYFHGCAVILKNEYLLYFVLLNFVKVRNSI